MITEAVRMDELGWAEQEERGPRMESKGPCWSLGKQAGLQKRQRGQTPKSYFLSFSFFFKKGEVSQPKLSVFIFYLIRRALTLKKKKSNMQVNILSTV